MGKAWDSSITVSVAGIGTKTRSRTMMKVLRGPVVSSYFTNTSTRLVCMSTVPTGLTACGWVWEGWKTSTPSYVSEATSAAMTLWAVFTASLSTAVTSSTSHRLSTTPTSATAAHASKPPVSAPPPRVALSQQRWLVVVVVVVVWVVWPEGSVATCGRMLSVCAEKASLARTVNQVSWGFLWIFFLSFSFSIVVSELGFYFLVSFLFRCCHCFWRRACHKPRNLFWILLGFFWRVFMQFWCIAQFNSV